MTGFKDGMIATRLIRDTILPEDYDACCRITDEERKDMLARFSYQVGHLFSILVLVLLPYSFG